MRDCVAIILAGGQYTRMGAANKLLLENDGWSLLQYALATYLGLDATTTGVVVDYETASIHPLLRPPNLQIVDNLHHRDGQTTLVLASLRQASAAQSYLVFPSDMPSPTVRDLDQLQAPHLALDQKKIAIPMRVDQRGNPIVIPHACLEGILADPVHLGCRGFTGKTQIGPISSTPKPWPFFKTSTLQKICLFGKN